MRAGTLNQLIRLAEDIRKKLMLSSSAIRARYSLPPRSRTKQWTCNRLGLAQGSILNKR